MHFDRLSPKHTESRAVQIFALRLEYGRDRSEQKEIVRLTAGFPDVGPQRGGPLRVAGSPSCCACCSAARISVAATPCLRAADATQTFDR